MSKQNFFTYADVLRVYKNEVDTRKDDPFRNTLSICYACSLLAYNVNFRDGIMLYIAKDIYGPIIGTIIYYCKRGTNPFIETAYPSIFEKLGITSDRVNHNTSFNERRIAILEKLTEKFPDTKIYF